MFVAHKVLFHCFCCALAVVMGLLTILKKLKQKEKEVRLLIL